MKSRKKGMALWMIVLMVFVLGILILFVLPAKVPGTRPFINGFKRWVASIPGKVTGRVEEEKNLAEEQKKKGTTGSQKTLMKANFKSEM